MPGFLDVLIGTAPTTETQQLDVRTEEQKKSLSQLLQTLSGKVADPGISGPSAAEQTSLAGLEQLAMNLVGEGADPNAALREQGAGVISDIFARGPADFEEEFRTTVQDPLLQSFQRDVLPGITRSFGGSKFFTSDRERAEGRAERSLFDTLTRERGRFAGEARREDIQAKMGGLGALESVDSTKRLLELFSGISEAGGGVRRAEIERAGGESIATRDLLGAIGTDVFENVVTQTPGTSGLLQSFLGTEAGGDLVSGGLKKGFSALKGLF